MPDSELTSDTPAGRSPPPPAASVQTIRGRRARALATALGGLLIVVIVIAALSGSGAGTGPQDGAAAIVPADALAYVNVSLDAGRSAVRQALLVATRFPDYPLAAGVVQSRLAAILGGGRSADYTTQIAPWLGAEAALALLNTTTATAGTLTVLDVRDHARAAAFVRGHGATARGSYRGTALLAYPTGSELAFISHYLVLGQDASVRAAIDVAAGKTASLAGASVFRRATSDQPADRVLEAYASLAGVRRLLAPQGGIIGALATLLYQPALQGVALSLSPTAQGVRLRVRSALDPSLTRLSPPGTPAFTPSLQNVMPAGAILMFDGQGLARIAPSVLHAGTVAGVAGGIGPLLSRLGSALQAEGVSVSQLTSIFAAETAVAIVPHQGSSTLVIIARTRHEAQVRSELASLEIPLAQLFTPPSTGPGNVPVFNDRTVGAVTAHQLVLASGFELDYAVFGGLVVISTSLQGVAGVVAHNGQLAADPGFRSVLASRPDRLNSLVYLDLSRLLPFAEQSGLANSATYRLLRADLQRISSIGLTSTRTSSSSTSNLTVQIR